MMIMGRAAPGPSGADRPATIKGDEITGEGNRKAETAAEKIDHSGKITFRDGQRKLRVAFLFGKVKYPV